MIKISEEEASFKGQLVRELIARVTSDHLIGQKFKNGEMRKKIVEPPWRCPASPTCSTTTASTCCASAFTRARRSPSTSAGITFA